MRVVRVQSFGGPEVLELQDAPVPDPEAGEVRVRLEVAGVNYIDLYQRSGQYPVRPPFVPGLEGAGIVEALGDDVTDFQVGERVAFGFYKGAYAEAVLVPTEKLLKVPENVPLNTAAALLLQGMTAHYLSSSTVALSAEHKVLIHAAAGGVGRLLVQLAKRRGAYVIGLVSTPEKAELAREAGADEVFLYADEDVVVQTRRLTGGKGLDVVYDSVGRTTFQNSLETLRPRGMMVLYGQASGPVAPFDLQLLNRLGSLFVTRPSLGHYLQSREELEWRSNDLFEWVGSGAIDVRIDGVYPLSEAKHAHRALASRATAGKVLLSCST